MDALEPGLHHVDTIEVTSSLTAVAYGSGDVPVLATPAVLGLAEGACVTALADNLDEGHTSVGTFAEVEHRRATPVGRTVTVEATLVDRDERQLEFEVVVREAAEAGDGATGGVGAEVVATVRHRRAIVDRQQFLERTGATDG